MSTSKNLERKPLSKALFVLESRKGDKIAHLDLLGKTRIRLTKEDALSLAECLIGSLRGNRERLMRICISASEEESTRKAMILKMAPDFSSVNKVIAIFHELIFSIE